MRNDADDDYQYDRTNRPASRVKPAHQIEVEDRAKRCLSFMPTLTHAALVNVCKNCNGPRYAHAAHALREKAS